MWDNPQEDRPAPPWPAWIGVAILLLALIALARAEGRAHSGGFEELRQSAAGWAYRVTGDWRFDSAEPPLAKIFLGLAVRADADSAPASLAGWSDGDALKTGRDLFSGKAGARRLLSARRVSLLFALILALGVFRWSNELWGPAGGFLSLAVCVLSPAIPGFASLATVGMAAAAFLFYAVYGFWRLYDRPAGGRALFAAIASGCAIASKYAGLQVFVIFIGLSALGVFFGGEFFPLLAPGRRTNPKALWLRMVWNYVAVFLLCVAGAWFVLWAVRGFGFSIGWYFSGLGADGNDEPGSFFAPVWTLLCRTHPAVLLFAVAGVLSVRQGRFYDTVFLVIAGLLSLLAVSAFMGTGRLSEILLIQVLIAVMAGAFLRSPFSLRGPQAVVALAGIIWLAIGAWNQKPECLSYTNFLAGDPDRAVLKLNPRDFDRGRDLPDLIDVLLPSEAVGKTVFYPGISQTEDLATAGIRNLADFPEEIIYPNPGLYVVNLCALRGAPCFADSALRFHWLEDYDYAERIGSGLFAYCFKSAQGKSPGDDSESHANSLDFETLYLRNESRLKNLSAESQNDETLLRVMSYGYRKRALQLLTSGKYGEAIDAFLAARETGSRSDSMKVEIAQGLARAYRATEQTEELLREIETIRTLEPGNSLADEMDVWLADKESEADEDESEIKDPAE